MASSKCLLLPSLPFELIEEILYKIPAESLIRFKSTCKKWYNLITEKRFMYNHLDHYSPERFIRTYDQQIIDPVTEILSDALIPDEFRDLYPIYSMVHCDGLMLCTCRKWDNSLAVWNPVLREIKWIKPSVCYLHTDYVGIGYDDNVSRDNYKILKLLGRLPKDDDSDPNCEIYEFKSDSWKTLVAKFDWDIDIRCNNGVSVKGKMYWIAKKKEDFTIIRFDFSTETFKEICVCPYTLVTRLGCFDGDRLSLLLQGEESQGIEVWMTNKLSDKVVSFSQYFNVTTPDLPALHLQSCMACPGYSIGKRRNIRVWCEGSVDVDDKSYVIITFYEIDEGGVIKQIETASYGQFEYDDPFICCYVYVPSLIPIQ
ncbi:hypothetical protein; 68748-67639 [Arabidopsis thaliana]|uniref:F-box protein At3g08750 n=1 Tax=Arabidopsis thaliana TaxID=3702 RepID=FB136_ARATH|nr:F-box and associated interaction domains-containing protein [Arabidopsis thaliana]Q9C9Y4.1 RecName: Full=F-box protein At3g08750 [Arabidopsis thaliana]AAG51357.1 hypothetical protein; 68748-67639 [Arabidopsis thaliana]AAY78736.1 F-box family protein [Arabidopsis thaliana]AEE74673.1 F-box and associated interaction domains-containing protein [Arabidopsis thaliana]|eukprot:NP_187487.1 F-box and associated interaction domains-containing protein [Arabidopsis thaliana]